MSQEQKDQYFENIPFSSHFNMDTNFLNCITDKIPNYKEAAEYLMEKNVLQL